MQYCFDVENCWQLSRELAAAADEFAADVAAGLFGGPACPGLATSFAAAEWHSRLGEQISSWAQTPGGAAAIADMAF